MAWSVTGHHNGMGVSQATISVDINKILIRFSYPPKFIEKTGVINKECKSIRDLLL